MRKSHHKALFKCATIMPNIIRPQYKILPTDNVPTATTIAAVVTATLKAGAVPAMPITADSNVPNEPLANPASDLSSPFGMNCF